MATATAILCLLFLEAFAGQATTDTNNNTTAINESATSPSIRRPLMSDRDSGHTFTYSRFGKKPKKRDMDRDYMIEMLGGGYDTHFLSEEPEIRTEISPSIELDQHSSPNWITEYMHNELEQLNITSEMLGLEGKSVVVITKYLDAFKRWLLEKADCPVHYIWQYVGPYFWPPWLKKGACSSTNGNCSWPSGMYCTPAETTTVQILRWQCPGALNKGKRRHRGTSGGTKARGGSGLRRGPSLERRKCQWIKVPYPIISACVCRC